jgi:hypothetical protein
MKPRPLAGSSFSGSETLSGYSNLTFDLNNGGSATMHDADGTVGGTWRQSGNQVTLTFYNGNVVYTGTWNGNALSGSATNGQRTWSWSLSR